MTGKPKRYGVRGVSAGGVAMTPVGGADPAAGPGEGPQAVRPGRGAA